VLTTVVVVITYDNRRAQARTVRGTHAANCRYAPHEAVRSATCWAWPLACS